MAIQLFNGALTNSFQATGSFLISGENITLDCALTIANVAVPGTPGQIEAYLEFTSSDPNALATTWYRECAEEDLGNGNIRMSKVVRRFAEEGSDVPLAEGTHNIDLQFVRKHAFCRLQIRVAPGGADKCSAIVTTVFGAKPLSAP